MAGILDRITDALVDTALGKIGKGLEQYCWLQEHVRTVDVSRNTDFQRKFNGFYRVRRNSRWRASYHQLMERAKSTGISFAEALQTLKRATGNIEASFVSKLVATLDPTKPIIDKFVLKNLGLRLPGHFTSDREQKTIRVYEQVCTAYAELTANAKGRMICEKFRLCYPEAEITEVKMIDLVLWQIRSVTQKA
jgi:hypothetical protein